MKRNIENIKEEESNIRALCTACQHKALADVIPLFEKCGGANVSCLGFTPIIFAVRNPNWNDAKEILLFLLINHTNFRGVDATKWTVLHHAVCVGSLEIVKTLISFGHAIDVKTNKGNTPLMLIASRRDDIEGIRIARFLIEKGADLLAKNNVFLTPLFVACISNASIEMVQLLGPKGHPCINETDHRGLSPLIIAIERSLHGKEYVSYLLSAGANTTVNGDSGHTMLSIAYIRSVDIMRLILPFALPADIQMLSRYYLPTSKCADVLGVMREARLIHKTPYRHSSFRLAIEKKHPFQHIWAILRMIPPCLDGSRNDYSNALCELAPTNKILWNLLAEALGGGRHPVTGNTLLHTIVREGNLDVLESVMYRQMICPFLVNNDLQTPMDLAQQLAPTVKNKPFIIFALQNYSSWKPTQAVTNWYGPFFRSRAKAFLLVCRRLKVFPRDIILVILGWIASMETV